VLAKEPKGCQTTAVWNLLGSAILSSLASCISRNRDDSGVVKLADGCNAWSRNEELSMRKQECFDYSRRALLGASGALAFLGALPQLGRDYGGALQGKIVLDACNAVPARDGVIADEVERDGVGITSQKYLPGTHLVRAFNTLSYTIFVREANRSDPKLAIPIA